MSETSTQLTREAQQKVEHYRQCGGNAELANALEGLASAQLKEADLDGAADALEEAARIWLLLDNDQRKGSCFLLAASTRRLANDLAGAQSILSEARSSDNSRDILNGMRVEECEQLLALGRFAEAKAGFGSVLSDLGSDLDDATKAELLQRKASAALGTKKNVQAARDLLEASAIYARNRRPADSEATALAAASVLAEDDNVSAEQILAEISRSPPTHGAAEARRGMVGGKVALESGNFLLAMQRFDQARQGALDVGDAITYHLAAVSASSAAEKLGDLETAYKRLAVAWTTLSKLVGETTAGQMLKPELEALKNRVGRDAFSIAKQAYEMQRRSDMVQK